MYLLGMPGHSDCENTCWVCLGGNENGDLVVPCKCPSMFSHPICLARWQLQQAGQDEENYCRFCKSQLPKWSEPLLENRCAVADSPTSTTNTANSSTAASHSPMMAVVFQGRVVKLPCDPGKEGAEAFKRQVRQIFNLAESVHLDVTFELKVPSSSLDQTMQKIYLKGFHTFQAASTVAAICASKRTLHTNNHSRPRHYLDYSDVIPAHRSRDQQQSSPAQQPTAPAASWPHAGQQSSTTSNSTSLTPGQSIGSMNRSDILPGSMQSTFQSTPYLSSGKHCIQYMTSSSTRRLTELHYQSRGGSSDAVPSVENTSIQHLRSFEAVYPSSILASTAQRVSRVQDKECFVAAAANNSASRAVACQSQVHYQQQQGMMVDSSSSSSGPNSSVMRRMMAWLKGN